MTFTLEGFNRLQRGEIDLSSEFTATVSPVMAVGRRDELVIVQAATPIVDVTNARQMTTFTGEQLEELPTARNITSILALTPGITSSSNRNGLFLPGSCSGGAGIFCSPNITDFNAHASANDTLDGLRQGRILIEGVPINSGVQGLITGMTAGYTTDIGNAREVNIQISGALGESETGGATFNIVPRTGGNRFAGTFNHTYTRKGWFDRNNGDYENIGVVNTIDYDYDVSASSGGPIKRDRLWFFAQARNQGKRATPPGGEFFYNANEGRFGANYVPDRDEGRSSTRTAGATSARASRCRRRRTTSSTSSGTSRTPARIPATASSRCSPRRNRGGRWPPAPTGSSKSPGRIRARRSCCSKAGCRSPRSATTRRATAI